MVTVRLAVGLRHHIDGNDMVQIEARSFDDVLDTLRITKDEMGMVLVNMKPVDARKRQELTLIDEDIVDIYPIFGGG